MNLLGTYYAFQFDTDRKGNVIDQDRQIKAFVNRFEAIFKKEPKEIIVGPVSLPNGQVIVSSTQVYMS